MSAPSTPSSSPDERRAALALTLVPDVGRVTYHDIVATFGSASRGLTGAFPPGVARAALAKADEQTARGAAAGLSFILDDDARYPSVLRDLERPPVVLWYRGDWAVTQRPMVAIVGTRRSTSYGERITRELAGALARAGACVVSGMAAGIDGQAHVAALEAGGATVAVLGTGADVAYPRGHAALHREIGARGLVLSELPPGAHSNSGSFPERNRIIAALARLTIVVEAPFRSGALITVDRALELGREVGVVPGPIDVPQCEGSNERLRDGAHAIVSVADAVALVGLTAPVRSAPALDDESERRVWLALQQSAASLDELCARAALPVQQCLTAVTGLEVRGLVECALTGQIRRR